MQRSRLSTVEVVYMVTKRKTEYQCPICKLPYMSKGTVERHIKIKHPTDENIIKEDTQNERFNR